MVWKRITMEEAENHPFDYDEALIEPGIKDSIPAAEAVGIFGPEKQKQRLDSGEGFSIRHENGKTIYISKNGSTFTI